MLSLALWDLTLYEVLADVPHDFAALVVYTMLALFIAFIWLGSRPAAPAGKDGQTPEA